MRTQAELLQALSVLCHLLVVADSELEADMLMADSMINIHTTIDRIWYVYACASDESASACVVSDAVYVGGTTTTATERRESWNKNTP